MAGTLTEAVIRRRLEEWEIIRFSIPRLREENRKMQQENRMLREEMRQMKRDHEAVKAGYEARIEALELRIEQLTQMVFGPPRSERAARLARRRASAEEGQRQHRTASSYRRRIPPEEEVTDAQTFPLSACPDCGSALRSGHTVTRYVEDIPLPLDEHPLKTVVKKTIECGYCERCRRKVSALPYGTQLCELGPNVKMYVCYAVTILGQTWGKLAVFLRDVYGLAISDGEIAAILRQQHYALLPALTDIEARIRDGPAAHYDETGWPVAEESTGNFGWVKTSAVTPDTLFRLGRTRGRGNAEELRGEDSGQPAVTDDLRTYDAVFQKHALCWAHACRKFRELAESSALKGRKLKRCQRFYAAFHSLYADVRAASERPCSAEERAAQAAAFFTRIAALCAPHSGDPAKLALHKETFLRNREEYLLCVREAGVPLTNNKAERALRPLVIKRKVSFGSKTHKGAQAMETLLSVLFTLWWSRPENFFAAYRNLLRAA